MGAALLAAATRARAQREPYRIAWLSPGPERDGASFLDAFRAGLREHGYVAGTNLVLDAWWGDNTTAGIDSITAAAIGRRPQVLVAQGPTAYAARRLAGPIPVVFAFSGDPVLAGFAASYAHPGGSMTGVSFLALEIVGKRIELLKTVLPQLERVAVLANAQHPGDGAERRVSAVAAAGLGLSIEYFELQGGGAGLDAALDAIRRSSCTAAVMFPVQPVISNAPRIAEWSGRYRIPALSGWSSFAYAGNLMSYGCGLDESFARAASFVDRILRGAPPGSLAVEVPKNIELVVNLKAARTLGVDVPRPVLLRATRVIE